MMKQKDGVYQVVTEVIGYAHTEEHEALTLTKEQRQEVKRRVGQMLHAGEIQLSAEARDKYSTEELCIGYANGLVDNWLRKDKRFNQGEAYVTKNPGSRQTDSVLRNLQALRKNANNATEEDLAQLDQLIENRKAEIAAERAKKSATKIDVSQIPPEFQHLIPNAS